MILKNDYKPKKFGKEYVKINGSTQYPMFVGTALGIKSCFDDWSEISKFDEFKKICKDYGLYIEPDVIFSQTQKNKKNIIGGNNITTTFFEGIKFGKNLPKQGNVHVYISKSKSKTILAKKFGWYSVIINNRSINKPFIDHLKFGEILGFPKCCIEFFKKYNNWHLYNHPYEIFKNTTINTNKAIGSYYCNNFLMDHTYFYIHNLPCSYRCKKTIDFAKKIELKISQVEKNFTKKTISLLKKPLLIFGERNFIIFDGIKKNNEIKYTNCQYFSNPGKVEEKINFFNFIEKGNKILFENNILNIYKNNSKIFSINNNKNWFMINFD